MEAIWIFLLLFSRELFQERHDPVATLGKPHVPDKQHQGERPSKKHQLEASRQSCLGALNTVRTCKDDPEGGNQQHLL